MGCWRSWGFERGIIELRFDTPPTGAAGWAKGRMTRSRGLYVARCAIHIALARKASTMTPYNFYISEGSRLS